MFININYASGADHKTCFVTSQSVLYSVQGKSLWKWEGSFVWSSPVGMKDLGYKGTTVATW